MSSRSSKKREASSAGITSCAHQFARLAHVTLGGLAMAGAAAVAAPSAYLALLTWFGAGRSSAPTESTAALTLRRFAVLIPAHDEERIIEQAVGSLRTQRYPSDLFEIHVVADHCTDRTAEIAAAAGATVHERIATDPPGKGAALNWVTDQVLTGDLGAPRPFDVVVIVDADTVVDPHFLEAMNRAFGRGVTAAQGYYAASDPSASPSIALRYAALASKHYLRPLGRSGLGGSVGLFGNGMAFSTELIRARRWSGHLIEDAEFQLELLLDGIKVDFVPDAVLSAEMPDTFESSVTQNQRWELGRAQLISRFVPDLLRAATRSPRSTELGRRTYLDAAADQLVPPFSLLAASNVVAATIAVAATAMRPTRANRLALGATTSSIVALIIHVMVALHMVRAPRSVYRSLASAPQFVLWKLNLLNNVRVSPTDVTWTRTQRNQGGIEPS